MFSQHAGHEVSNPGLQRQKKETLSSNNIATKIADKYQQKKG